MGSHEFSRNQKIVMNSGHGTEKFFSMGIEILGLGIYCCIK